MKLEELPTQLGALKALLAKASIIGYEEAILISKSDSPVTSDPVDLCSLKYAVLVERPDTALAYAPVSFYVRKPDKKGIKVSLSLYSTVRELAEVIEDKLQIPVLSQELLFNGERIEDFADSLQVLGLRELQVFHVIDKRLILVDLETAFAINLQGASLKSEVVPLEVKGKTTLGELRFKASEKFGLPLESTIIAYCSQILDNTDKSLFTTSLIGGAFVKVLDERLAKVLEQEKEQDTTFEVRKKRALEPEEKGTTSQHLEVIRQADSVLLTDNKDISILNSEVGADKSYAESFRINESYEETYNRAIKRQQGPQTHHTPEKEPPQGTNPFLKNLTESPPIIESPQLNEESSPVLRPDKVPATAPQEEIRRADSIKQYQVRVQDLFNNAFELTVCEIDTVRDIKSKLEIEHPEAVTSPQDFILEGKVLDDDQILKDLLVGEDCTLFMMPKAE